MLEVIFYTTCSIGYIYFDRKCWNASDKVLELHTWV